MVDVEEEAQVIEVDFACRHLRRPLPKEPCTLIRAPRGLLQHEVLERALLDAGADVESATLHGRVLVERLVVGHQWVEDFGYDEVSLVLPRHECVIDGMRFEWTLEVLGPGSVGWPVQGEDAEYVYLALFTSRSSLGLEPAENLRQSTGIHDGPDPLRVSVLLKKIVLPIFARVGSDFAFGTHSTAMRRVLVAMQLRTSPYLTVYVPLSKYLWTWGVYSEEMCVSLGLSEENAREIGCAGERSPGGGMLVWNVGVDRDEWSRQAFCSGLYSPMMVRFGYVGQDCVEDCGWQYQESRFNAACPVEPVDAELNEVMGVGSPLEARLLGRMPWDGNFFPGPGQDEVSVFGDRFALHTHPIREGEGCRQILERAPLGGSWASDGNTLVMEMQSCQHSYLVLGSLVTSLGQTLVDEGHLGYDESLDCYVSRLWRARPRLSRDGTKVVYRRPRLMIEEDEMRPTFIGSEVCLVDVVTREARPIVVVEGDEAILEPVWSPGSDRLGYVHHHEMECSLVICDLDGHGLGRYAMPGIVCFMDWAPARSLLVMAITSGRVEFCHGEMRPKEGARLAIFDLESSRLDYISEELYGLEECYWMLDSVHIAFSAKSSGGNLGLYVGRYNHREEGASTNWSDAACVQ